MKRLWQRSTSVQESASSVPEENRHPVRLGSVGLTYAMSVLEHQHGRATRADAKLLGITAMAAALVVGIFVLDVGFVAMPAMLLGGGAVLIGALGLFPVKMQGFPGIANIREQAFGETDQDVILWWFADSVSSASEATEKRVALKLNCFTVSLLLLVSAVAFLAMLAVVSVRSGERTDTPQVTMPVGAETTPTIPAVIVDLERQQKPDR